MPFTLPLKLLKKNAAYATNLLALPPNANTTFAFLALINASKLHEELPAPCAETPMDSIKLTPHKTEQTTITTTRTTIKEKTFLKLN